MAASERGVLGLCVDLLWTVLFMNRFLGDFAKFRKANVNLRHVSLSFRVPIRLSVRMKQLCYICTDFNQILY
jgi:hypothetical protein